MIGKGQKIVMAQRQKMQNGQGAAMFGRRVVGGVSGVQNMQQVAGMTQQPISGYN